MPKNKVRRTSFIGVEHRTGIGQIPALFKVLQTEGNPPRAGIEFLENRETIERSKRDARFFKAVFLMARRKGIQLVPLEESSVNSSWALLNDLLDYWLVRKKVRAPDYLPLIEDAAERAYPHNQNLGLILRRLRTSFRALDLESARQLYFALARYRSTLMEYEAGGKAVSHSIVGASHAEDLQGKARILFTTDVRKNEAEKRYAKTGWRRFRLFLKRTTGEILKAERGKK